MITRPTHDFLQKALPDLAWWTAYFRKAEIPVLSATAAAIEDLRAIEDEVDAHMVADAISGDPLMSLKVMAFASANRHRSVVTASETVTSAVVMMGIGPFFRHFGPQITVDDWLADHPEGLAGLQSVIRRAERAAAFALGFAVHRMDYDAQVIHLAALLHDFAEMLLWCHAPDLACDIRSRQKADKTLRSSVAQQQVLHIHLPDLEQALMHAWHLPELLVMMTDDKREHNPQVQTVKFAMQLARHTSEGWHNAALPDDLGAIAALLNLSTSHTLALLHEIDGHQPG